MKNIKTTNDKNLWVSQPMGYKFLQGKKCGGENFQRTLFSFGLDRPALGACCTPLGGCPELVPEQWGVIGSDKILIRQDFVDENRLHNCYNPPYVSKLWRIQCAAASCGMVFVRVDTRAKPGFRNMSVCFEDWCAHRGLWPFGPVDSCSPYRRIIGSNWCR